MHQVQTRRLGIVRRLQDDFVFWTCFHFIKKKKKGKIIKFKSLCAFNNVIHKTLTKPLFFSYKRNILTLIWRKKKSFFFDLQENFPKVRTVYKLFFVYNFVAYFGVLHERSWYIYSANSGVISFFRFNFASYHITMRPWENASLDFPPCI